MTCAYCHDDPDAPTYGQWVTSLPLTPSANDAVSHRGSIAESRAYARLRDSWRTHVRLWRERSGMPYASGLRRAVFTRWAPRPLDKINFAAGCKSLLDAMVLERVLDGDTPAKLRDHYLQEKPRPGDIPRLMVAVTALTPDAYQQDVRCYLCREKTPPDDRLPIYGATIRADAVVHALCAMAATSGDKGKLKPRSRR